MYSPRLNKYQDSYVLYIPYSTHSTHLRFGNLYTYSFGTDTNTRRFRLLVTLIDIEFTYPKETMCSAELRD